MNDIAINGAIEEEAKEEQLTLFMLGDTDVGKTYFVTSIANSFYEQGLRVAVVDADVGQSDIGPPCCIGMGFLERRIRTLSEVPLYSLYFVGNISPNGCVRECVKGVAMVVKKAKEFKADVIIVDSTGWIEGEEAKRFKLLEVEEINPSFVIAIEKDNELEDIILHLKNNTNSKVIKRCMSKEARSRTREERRALREEAYGKYFRTAKNRVFEFPLFERLPEEGTILGLFNGEESLGLGILRKLYYERSRAAVFTPVDADTREEIKWIKPGAVKLRNSDGRLKET